MSVPRTANYQAILPTTWNAGPRDAKDDIRPYQADLLGMKMADPEPPLQILRTRHSFDACLACATRALDAAGTERRTVRVRCGVADR